jgi:1-acyl-sn-glycerol-3-phosphate acyltransferase
VTFYRVVRAVVLSVCKVLFRVRVIGREHVPKDGVYVVAPSHRSILDIPFAAFVTRRRIRFMAKKELFSTRLGGWLFSRLGGIPVDREATDRAALRVSVAALEDGEPLAIFPEGTRHHGPVLGDLFDGAAYLAAKLDVAIVPVGVGGSEKILASGKVLPRIHKVVVVVGEPVVPPTSSARRRPRSEVHALTEVLRERLQACFDEAQAAAGVDSPSDPATRDTERSEGA